MDVDASNDYKLGYGPKKVNPPPFRNLLAIVPLTIEFAFRSRPYCIRQ
jgi:hypothetical protein